MLSNKFFDIAMKKERSKVMSFVSEYYGDEEGYKFPKMETIELPNRFVKFMIEWNPTKNKLLSLTGGALKLFIWLSSRINADNTVTCKKSDKSEFIKNMVEANASSPIRNERRIQNMLTELCDKKVLFRVSRGVYYVHPNIMFSGKEEERMEHIKQNLTSKFFKLKDV